MAESNSKQSGRRGCFFYGCLVTGVFLVIILLGGLFGLHYARKMFNTFTATTPAVLPASTLTPQQAQSVHERVRQFRENVGNNRGARPLELSADEINALIQTEADLQALKGKLHAIIEANRLKAQVSVPMDDLGLSMFRGRYLNGLAELDIVFSNGILRVIPTRITVNGRDVPQVYLETIRKQNLARSLNTDERSAAALGKLQTIAIEDGKLTIVPKPPAP
jgi:hypothetical protein